VNHSGDSDSTGAIVGNLVGAYRGVAAIKDEWRSSVELHETIKAVGDQLATVSLLRGRAEKISGVEAPE
jgi:ADP-ribosylglycohydrolase